MPVGTLTENVKDGGLGVVPTSTANTFATLGVCTGGTVNTLYAFSSMDDLQTTGISGPAVDACAQKLALAGGPQYLMPINASVPGVAGTVTPTRVAASTGTVSTSGTPNDAYVVSVTVASAGTGQLVSSGNVQITYTLDGGTTTSQLTTVPSSGTLVLTGTGVTLTFSLTTTTFDKNDMFAFTCSAPFYAAADINAACTALGNDVRTWGMLHLVGFPTAGTSSANATSSATLFSTLATNMATFATNGRYARAIMEAPPSLDADLTTAFANSADARVMVCATTANMNSPITGRKLVRGWGTAVAARLAQVRVSRSPGAYADGPIAGVTAITRDERKTAALYDSRFCISQTILGAPGFYTDTGRMMAPLGSDFTFVMNGRVMDQASITARAAGLTFLNASVRVNSANGAILEQDARAIEKFIDTAIRNAIVQPGDASDCSVVVNRTDNILSTSLLRIKVRIVPLGYASSISIDIGFTNPALALS